MPKKPRDDWQDAIQSLIDDFPDDRYLELLDAMLDLATTARDARLEEEAKKDDPDR